MDGKLLSNATTLDQKRYISDTRIDLVVINVLFISQHWYYAERVSINKFDQLFNYVKAPLTETPNNYRVKK
jgi:hypothetical protein